MRYVSSFILRSTRVKCSFLDPRFLVHGRFIVCSVPPRLVLRVRVATTVTGVSRRSYDPTILSRRRNGVRYSDSRRSSSCILVNNDPKHLGWLFCIIRRSLRGEVGPSHDLSSILSYCREAFDSCSVVSLRRVCLRPHGSLRLCSGVEGKDPERETRGRAVSLCTNFVTVTI